VSGIAQEDSSESRVRERRSESSLEAAGVAHALQTHGRPPGNSCSPANGTPEELGRLVLRVINSFTAPVLLDYRTSDKNLWGCSRMNVYEHY